VGRTEKSWSASSLLIEIFSIVLGVLLALALSEWNEDRNHRELAQAALQNVNNEIRSNAETLHLIHDNNTATLAAIEADPGPDGDESLTFIPGAQLQETAWEALLSTGLSAHLDYQTVLSLSEMYAIQRVYKESGVQVSEAAMHSTAVSAAMGTELDDRHFTQQFKGYFGLLTQIEAQLLEAYDEVLSALEQS
jgi:hypothetical protein